MMSKVEQELLLINNLKIINSGDLAKVKDLVKELNFLIDEGLTLDILYPNLIFRSISSNNVTKSQLYVIKNLHGINETERQIKLWHIELLEATRSDNDEDKVKFIEKIISQMQKNVTVVFEILSETIALSASIRRFDLIDTIQSILEDVKD